MTLWNKSKENTTDASKEKEAQETLKLLFSENSEYYCCDCGSTKVKIREKRK